MQLDLFTAAPTMARPIRPDTAMLLAMSDDFHLGGEPRAWPVPNQHGCYDKREAESIELPNPRKGWRGGPLAEIYLLELADGWIFETGVSMPNNGYSGPLSTHCGYSATRAEALSKASAKIIKYCTRDRWDYESDAKVAASIRAWAEGLGGLV